MINYGVSLNLLDCHDHSCHGHNGTQDANQANIYLAHMHSFTPAHELGMKHDKCYLCFLPQPNNLILLLILIPNLLVPVVPVLRIFLVGAVLFWVCRGLVMLYIWREYTGVASLVPLHYQRRKQDKIMLVLLNMTHDETVNMFCSSPIAKY